MEVIINIYKYILSLGPIVLKNNVFASMWISYLYDLLISITLLRNNKVSLSFIQRDGDFSVSQKFVYLKRYVHSFGE